MSEAPLLTEAAAQSEPLPYADAPALTESMVKEILKAAYTLGAMGFHHRPLAEGGPDWQEVLLSLDSIQPLPLAYNHAIINHIKTAYRKGYRENNNDH
jgi:hypothetical protein